MTRYSLILTLTILSTALYAQDTREFTVLDGSTSATASGSTTSTATASSTLSATTGTALSRQFTAENFAKRWKLDEASYRKAGLSNEKIKQLREMDERTWKARAAGEKLDFAKLGRERAAILTEEETKKLRDVRREMINQQLNSSNNSSTQTAR